MRSWSPWLALLSLSSIEHHLTLNSMWGGSELNEHTPHAHRPNSSNVKCIIYTVLYTVYTHLHILSTAYEAGLSADESEKKTHNDKEFISVVRWYWFSSYYMHYSQETPSCVIGDRHWFKMHSSFSPQHVCASCSLFHGPYLSLFETSRCVYDFDSRRILNK